MSEILNKPLRDSPSSMSLLNLPFFFVAVWGGGMELKPSSRVDQTRAMRPNSNVFCARALFVFSRTKPNGTKFVVGRRLQ